jgi:hypothetical protein
MSRNRRTKYISGYGYVNVVRGEGIGDIFTSIWRGGRKLLTRIPQQMIEATKDASINVATKGIKAIGEKAGDKIADKIVAKSKANNSTAHSPSKQATPEIRRQVLQELSLLPPDNIVAESSSPGIPSDLYNKFYGSGMKKKRLTGYGIKIL